MTVWDDQESMRQYMTAGAHRVAMPRLIGWCDEASVVHWDQADDVPPSWSDAAERMRAVGRPSKVRFPSAQHADLAFQPPKRTSGGSIRPTPSKSTNSP